MPVLAFALTYLLGSLVSGVLYSRWRGEDIRGRDLPGGSGTFRQYGRGAAVLVTGLDILRGALAGGLGLWLAPEAAWVAALGVVLGHCYPVFFRFRGGGGIAPLMGVLLVLAPWVLLVLLAVGLPLIPVYRATLQKALLTRGIRLNAVPVATACAVLAGLWFAARYGGLDALLAGGGAMALRGVHLLVGPRPPALQDS